MPERARLFSWFGIALLVVLLDHWTKGLAVDRLDYGRPLAVLPFLNLSLQFNPGAAFSFLSEAGGWQRWFFSAVAVAASIAIGIWLSRLRAGEWLVGLGLSLILGGALGNLWDRLSLGHVVDFISLHYAGNYFPAFNLADSAITLGAALVVLDAVLQRDGGGSGN